MSAPRIVTVLQGVHMGLGHHALAELIRVKLHKKVSDLTFGQVILCLNKKGDKLKAIGAQGMVLGYVKTPTGQKLMLDAVQWLPKTFGAAGFNYDAAVKKVLVERFAAKGNPA